MNGWNRSRSSSCAFFFVIFVSFVVMPPHLRTPLQPKDAAAQPRPPRGASRVSRALKAAPPARDSFEGRYPHIASWVQHGWIEIGRDDRGQPFLRAMDIGGVVWEGNGGYPCLDQAMPALDNGIGESLEENGSAAGRSSRCPCPGWSKERFPWRNGSCHLRFSYSYSLCGGGVNGLWRAFTSDGSGRCSQGRRSRSIT
jgi:hypothetical protein